MAIFEGSSKGAPDAKRNEKDLVPGATAMNKSTAQWPTTDHPSDVDVLCGRGGACLRHPGNATFRFLVSSNKTRYAARRKIEKLNISRWIVKQIRDSGGRFLERDLDTWHDIGDKRAVEKTSQALREGQPKLRGEIESKTATNPTASPKQVAGSQKVTDEDNLLRRQLAEEAKKLGKRRMNSQDISKQAKAIPFFPFPPQNIALAFAEFQRQMENHQQQTQQSGTSLNQLWYTPNVITPSTKSPVKEGKPVRGSVEDDANLLLQFSRKNSSGIAKIDVEDAKHLAVENMRVMMAYSGLAGLNQSGFTQGAPVSCSDEQIGRHQQYPNTDRRRLFARSINEQEAFLPKKLETNEEELVNNAGALRQVSTLQKPNVICVDNDVTRTSHQHHVRAASGSIRSTSLASYYPSQQTRSDDSSEGNSTLTDLARRLESVSTTHSAALSEMSVFMGQEQQPEQRLSTSNTVENPSSLYSKQRMDCGISASEMEVDA